MSGSLERCSALHVFSIIMAPCSHVAAPVQSHSPGHLVFFLVFRILSEDKASTIRGTLVTYVPELGFFCPIVNRIVSYENLVPYG